MSTKSFSTAAVYLVFILFALSALPFFVFATIFWFIANVVRFCRDRKKITYYAFWTKVFELIMDKQFEK